MPFDPAIPQFLSPVESAPVRGNFNALATHHRGPTEPPNAQDGWVWIDTSNAANVRLRVRHEGSFKVIIEHLEGIPRFPQSFIKYVHEQPIAATQWQIVHDLGTKDVVIQCYDPADLLMLPGQLVSQNINKAVATFNAPRAGRAVVLG